ncbi:MAG: hypothetical protein ACM3ZV_13895 [Bacillota bacterium]
MIKVPNHESAASRARWLAELAQALDEARHVAKELGADEGRIEAVELYARIEAARLEVEMMRLRRSAGGGQDYGPEWTKDIPWRLSA